MSTKGLVDPATAGSSASGRRYMKCEIQWRSKYTFDGKIRQHTLIQDAKSGSGGADLGPTPKELLLASICGCTAMDVIGLMKKHKIELESLKVAAEAETTTSHPKVFEKVVLVFEATGPIEGRDALVESVQKSQSLYCGVSAMIAQTCPIEYRILLNGEVIGDGKADFPKIV